MSTRFALASTALTALLAFPGAAAAQSNDCIEILGTVDSDVEAAGLSAEARAEADALIVGARDAAEAGDEAACIASLRELQGVLGDSGGRLAQELSAIEPAAGAAAGAEETDAEAAAEIGTDPQPEEQTDAEIVEEGTAADADVELETGPEAQTRPGNAAETLAGWTAGELEGMDILTPDGDDVGSVEFFVIDMDGNVHVVVSLDDGFLGIGDTERVVSLDRFDFDANNEAFMLTGLDQQWLESLPEFDSETPGYTEIDADAAAFVN